MEAIRALMVAERTARSERTQTINQARALILTGPDDLRARFSQHAPADLVAELAVLRPRPGEVVGYATRVALRELGRRAEFPGAQLERLDDLIVPLVTAALPACSRSTASARTPPPSSWSPPEIIRGGCAPKLRGRTCALSPRSPPRRGRSPATAQPRR